MSRSLKKILFILGVGLIILTPRNVSLAANKSHIGDSCKNDITNSDCEIGGADLDCEESDKKDQAGNNLMYCTANSNADCEEAYGTPTKGKWTRSSGAVYTYDLAYCYNESTNEARTPIGINPNVSPTGKLADIVFDGPAASAALLKEVTTFKPELEVRLPGLQFSDLSKTVDAEGYLHIPWIGEFIKAVYNFGLGIISIVAVIMIIIQGARIIVSGGEGKVEGYKKIGQIVVGLFIAWGSYAILYTINPSLVEFNSLKVKYIPPDTLERYNETVNPPDATPIITGGASTFGANGIPDFKQCDSRWKNLPYDGIYNGQPLGCFKETPNAKGKYEGSICTSGCGVTSLADILVYYGHSEITPVDTARYAVEVGARVGCYGSRSAVLCANINSRWSDLTCRIIDPTKETAKIISSLREKKPVQFSCHDCHGFTKDGKDSTYKAHFMVLTGVDESGTWFSVNDPGRLSGMVKISITEFTAGRIASTFIVDKK